MIKKQSYKLMLQEFIASTPDWHRALSDAPYHLKVNLSSDYAMFNYSIDTDMSLPISQECRGIVINITTGDVVCFPFVKFFNHGDPLAPTIDWSTARVQEKIDGSIIKMWYHKKWRISTNATIDAYQAPVGGEDVTFGDLVDEALDNTIQGLYQVFLDSLNKDYTYMFELAHPKSRIVIAHTEPELYHIGTRDNITGKELIVDIGIPKPKTYSFAKLDDVIATAKDLPFNDEGYVVVDGSWNRVKIKSPAYVTVHRMKMNGEMTDARLLSAIISCKMEAILEYFPEFQPLVDKVNNKLQAVIDAISKEATLLEGRIFESRKDYAEVVRHFICPDFFFKVRDGKFKFGDIRKYIMQMHVTKIIQLMNKVVK